jgi:(p)ppGpp synthase/HD superfamily hydrolase
MLTDRFDAALVLAHRVHRTQTRKQTSVPYMAHLLGVAALTLEYGGSEDEAIGALLHDAIEDAPAHRGPAWVRARIHDGFGEAVLEIVEHCTDTDEQPKPPWLDRKTRYLGRLPDAPQSALLVSAADKLHNVTAVLRDFRRVGDEVWTRFNPAAGKVGTVGYYRALADVFTRCLRNPIADDLKRLVVGLEMEAGQAGTWPPPRT